MGAIKVTDQNFKNEVLDSSEPVLVDFWAEWCGPCKMLGPILHDITEEVENVTVLKINVDEGDNSALSAQFGVRGIPTVIIFKDGEQVDKFIGLKQKSDIMSIIEKNTEPKADESKD